MVKWRTSRPHEKNVVYEWEFTELEEALEYKKEKEAIKENIEVKLFKVEITEI